MYIHIHNIQDGVTADEVAKVHGHHAVCEELRKHMHGDHRPLSKVCTHVDVGRKMSSVGAKVDD